MFSTNWNIECSLFDLTQIGVFSGLGFLVK